MDYFFSHSGRPDGQAGEISRLLSRSMCASASAQEYSVQQLKNELDFLVFSRYWLVGWGGWPWKKLFSTFMIRQIFIFLQISKMLRYIILALYQFYQLFFILSDALTSEKTSAKIQRAFSLAESLTDYVREGKTKLPERLRSVFFTRRCPRCPRA